jgi:excisionase family DNA binding protein
MKNLPKNHLSVTQAANICGVGRTTIGYWIRAGRVRAIRIGHTYAIPAGELIHHLKLSGQSVPIELARMTGSPTAFRPICPCSDFMAGTIHGKACGECVVYNNKLSPCFTVRASATVGCYEPCFECRYFNEIYMPRLQMVFQQQGPAAIIKGLNIWAGNQPFADLCGLSVGDLIGIGIERIVHSDSLLVAMDELKRFDLEGLDGPRAYDIRLKGKDGPANVKASVYPLTEPEGAVLVVIK